MQRKRGQNLLHAGEHDGAPADLRGREPPLVADEERVDMLKRPRRLDDAVRVHAGLVRERVAADIRHAGGHLDICDRRELVRVARQKRDVVKRTSREFERVCSLNGCLERDVELRLVRVLLLDLRQRVQLQRVRSHNEGVGFGIRKKVPDAGKDERALTAPSEREHSKYER